MLEALRAGISRWLPAPPSGPLPLALPRRRIYIVPSRFGLVYGGALLLLMLGSLNYNNNAAILLALILAVVALLSAVSAVRHLSRLSVTAFDTDEAFAGDAQSCRLMVNGKNGPIRGDVSLRHADVEIPAQADASNELVFAWRWPSLQRGRRRLGRIRLSTTYPLGLFYAWCLLDPHVDAIVYPQPETPPADLPQTLGFAGNNRMPSAGEDDWHALREFQRGDSLRDVAWKTSARHDRWLVAERRTNTTATSLRFTLEQVAALDRERGISRIARWLLIAEAAQTPYALTLPGTEIATGLGSTQRRRALTALADLP